MAGVAASVSVLACYPKLSLWLKPSAPIWYLAAVIFLCSIFLWGFVFAWHIPCTGRPVFTLKLGLKPFWSATVLGILAAAMFRLWLDPPLRSIMPEDYPVDLEHWLANVLFSLALIQLFLVFAPFDWLIRLLKNRWLAASLTALFGAGVLALKIQAHATPVPPLLLAFLLAGRITIGFLTVWLYLRGGVILVWWWTLLLALRLLPGLVGNS
jgi:hypothetical protein